MSWGGADATAKELLSWFLLCGAKCFHPTTAVEDFWDFGPLPPHLLLLWRKRKSLLCFHVSAFLRVMGILRGNAVGHRDGHENKTEELGEKQL